MVTEAKRSAGIDVNKPLASLVSKYGWVKDNKKKSGVRSGY